jgi:thiamine biosynthesis lipoprotein
MPRDRFIHVEHVWGTVVSIDVALHRSNQEQVSAAISAVIAMLHDVDEVFSTFKPHSQVSQLRAGALDLVECNADVRDVEARCARIKALTKGAFDPWLVPGGFDPSGMVKGWAADRAADIFSRFGFGDVMIAAGGDVTVRGESEPGLPWVIGLQHPKLPGQIHATVTLHDGAVATSGRYERGDHITAQHVISAASATVVGPDGATADALATALLIAGLDGMSWFDRLPRYSAQVVLEDQVFSRGEAFNVDGLSD